MSNNSDSLKIITNVLDQGDINDILNSDIVQQKRQLLQNTNKIRFNLEVNDSVKNKLIDAFNLHSINELSEIPMTWIKGNTPEHRDFSADGMMFKNTYLLYLTDSYGNFVINDETYDMLANTGYIFNEGLRHKTINIADNSERLLFGPINEYITPVGASRYIITPDTGPSNGGNVITITDLLGPFSNTLEYYSITSTSNDSIRSNEFYIDPITPNIMVITMKPSTYWYDAIIGLNNIDLIFAGGSLIIGQYTYTEAVPCFKSDTKILTDKGYELIQDLRQGDLVKTFKNGFVPINMIGKRGIYHPASKDRIVDQLYKCSPTEYPEMFEDLVLTGAHSILVDSFKDKEQHDKTLDLFDNKIYFTDDKTRLPACIDERASVYDVPGNYTIYHLALDNDDYYNNYGIYANGILVETCSKRYLKELSDMELI